MSAANSPRSQTSSSTPSRDMKLCMFSPEGSGSSARLARPDRRRPRDPTRRPDTPGLLHRRRRRTRARRVPARRGRSPRAGAVPAVGAELQRIVARLRVLEYCVDLRARGRDSVPAGREHAQPVVRSRCSDRRRRLDRRLHPGEHLGRARAERRKAARLCAIDRPDSGHRARSRASCAPRSPAPMSRRNRCSNHRGTRWLPTPGSTRCSGRATS